MHQGESRNCSLTLACLLNISSYGIRDELVDHLLQVCSANLPGDDVCHLLSDVLDLGALGVTSLLGGLVLLPGEADAEHPQHVAVSGLHIHVALHKGLPLLHHGPQLVGGEVHTVEAGQAVLALDILDHQLELSVGPLGVILVLEVSKGHLEHATLQTVRGDPGAGGSENMTGQIMNPGKIQQNYLYLLTRVFPT